MADTYSTGAMPDSESYVTDETGDARGGGLGRIINLLGAAVSLGLVGGIAAWSYNLIQRDVSGVPVVRALEGPMRVAPDNPGGSQAEHQGLAVNAVAAHGAAAPTANRLTLAPRPVELEEADRPAEPEPAVLLPGSASQAIDVSFSATDAAVQMVLQEALGTDGAVPGIDAALVRRPDPAVVNAPGVKRSIRPKRRPGNAALATVTPTSYSPAAAAPVDLDPADLPPGTRLVQLGAFDTPDEARLAWDGLGVRFTDYMAGKQRVIQQATSAGQVFYRLRAAGFEDLADARRFCSALSAEQADCIPVTTR